jgi:hypothetical protein
VQHGKPAGLDRAEPARVAEAVRSMDLRYVVITSVDRDDLEVVGGHRDRATAMTRSANAASSGSVGSGPTQEVSRRSRPTCPTRLSPGRSLRFPPRSAK